MLRTTRSFNAANGLGASITTIVQQPERPDRDSGHYGISLARRSESLMFVPTLEP
jgi:hypothetical protein